MTSGVSRPGLVWYVLFVRLWRAQIVSVVSYRVSKKVQILTSFFFLT